MPKDRWFPTFQWTANDKLLPPFFLFPTIEFVFKVVQWSFFVAAVRFGAHRIGSNKLELTANCLQFLLILIIGERVTRAIYGRFTSSSPNGKALGAVLFLIAGASLFSWWVTVQLSGVLGVVISEFVEVSELAAAKR